MNAARNSCPTLVGNFIAGNDSGEDREELPAHVANGSPLSKAAIAARLKAIGTPPLPPGGEGESERKEEKDGEGF
jgi:hypothetical protein